MRAKLGAFTVEQEAKPLAGDQAYDRLRSAVPVLHFMSMTVAFDDQYDPIFVLEANFDGEPGPFWGQLEAAMGPLLRDVFRLCKPPRDQRLALFNAVTAVDSSVPLAPLLEAFTVMPAVSHQGNRGIERARIIAEGKLFQALRNEVDSNPALHSTTASNVHSILRAKLLPTFPWLSEPVAPRIGFAENIADHLRLFGFSAALVLAFYGVGWLLKLIAQAMCPALASTQLWLPEAWGDMAWVRCTVSFFLLTLLGVLAVLPATVWRVRQLEQHDATNDAPRLNEAALRAMARNEDYVAQNHMISIVHIKPGILRMILAQTDPAGLGFGPTLLQPLGLPGKHAHHPLRALGRARQRRPADVPQQLRRQLGKLSRRLHRESTRRPHASMDARCGLSAHALALHGRRHRRPQVQSLGAAFDEPEPVLVQRLQGILGEPDRKTSPSS